MFGDMPIIPCGFGLALNKEVSSSDHDEHCLLTDTMSRGVDILKCPEAGFG